MSCTTDNYFAYWGKAGDGLDHHLLPFHSLDVAAVGYVLLEKRAEWRRHLSQLLKWSPNEVGAWLPFLIALHDIGKFSSAFQGLRKDIALHLRRDFQPRGYSERHDTLGFLLWRRALHQSLFDQHAIPMLPRPGRRAPASIDYLIRAVTGHHGRPPEQPAKPHLPDWFEEVDQAAAGAFVKDVAAIFLRDNGWPSSQLDDLKDASWWIAGFTVLCDWVGSNRRYFPYRSGPMPLAEYWDEATDLAAAAVDDCGISSIGFSECFSLNDCFPKEAGTPQATPLQKVAGDWPLCEGPQLFILEDVTGAGKTEAALLLAYRMMRHGLGGSLYFALPTMATANAMYSRLGSVYLRMFKPGDRPSLVLAHGRAGQMSEFRDTVLPADGKGGAEYGDSTTSATASCASWLADNRKKALLANVGVGTIDQAMLAILHARHQSLRLLGLLDKLLIIDEVHACDAYMLRLLEQLLRAHARAGGSAVLLSATLAAVQRERLMSAFAEGCGADDKPLESATAYPALSHLAGAGRRTYGVGSAAASKRDVAVAFVDDTEAVYRWLGEAAANGGCACWIRNSVRDAREAWKALKSRYPDLDVQLFHARYCLRDRLDIERHVLSQFGKSSNSNDRSGRVLIATQVVEQSLDVDFDVLISDLAPVDRLIQRAGRLHRHPRAANGDYVTGVDQRGSPVLHVYAPAWSDNPGKDWLRNKLPGTAAVYSEMDAHMWLTQKMLLARGGFRTPDDVRPLVEGVYGPEAEQEVPEGLKARWQARQGGDLADASVGSLNGIRIQSGYVSEGVWTDDTVTPTRLGEPSVTVVLGRREAGAITFWAEEDGWAMSSLQILAKHATEGVKPDDVSEEAWDAWLERLPARGRWCVPMILSESVATWSGVATAGNGKETDFVYDVQSGLEIGPA